DGDRGGWYRSGIGFVIRRYHFGGRLEENRERRRDGERRGGFRAIGSFVSRLDGRANKIFHTVNCVDEMSGDRRRSQRPAEIARIINGVSGFGLRVGTMEVRTRISGVVGNGAVKIDGYIVPLHEGFVGVVLALIAALWFTCKINVNSFRLDSFGAPV